VLAGYGEGIPTYIPEANAFARKAAGLIGGTAMSMVTEILFDTPGTARIMGSCPMAESAERGVVDGRNRVFGHRNMYVYDGSACGSNLGVNPSLTISALTEACHELHTPGGRDGLERFRAESAYSGAVRTY
jgi:cholesterol oxidase